MPPPNFLATTSSLRSVMAAWVSRMPVTVGFVGSVVFLERALRGMEVGFGHLVKREGRMGWNKGRRDARMNVQ
jgi:hypothetical protein